MTKKDAKQLIEIVTDAQSACAQSCGAVVENAQNKMCETLMEKIMEMRQMMEDRVATLELLICPGFPPFPA